MAVARNLLPSLALAMLAGCGGGGGSSDRPDAQAGADGAAGQDGAASPDAAGSGAFCGGFGGGTCEGEEYCDYDRNSCGAADGGGSCLARPEGCGQLYEPVCGCDGEVYSNDCFARAAGVDVSSVGGCEAPEGTFACGYRFCQVDGSYCRASISDVASLPDYYECIDVPQGCGDSADCECLAGEPCGDFCEEDEGNFTLTCPGG